MAGPMTSPTEAPATARWRTWWAALRAKITLPAGVRAAEFAAALGAVAITVPLYGSCFSGRSYLVPTLVAAASPALLVVLARKSGPLGRAAIAIAGMLVVTVVVLLPTWNGALPTAATWSELRSGLVGGWLRLLTSARPVDPLPSLRLVPTLITYWCAWAAASSCLWGRRVAGPVVPGIVALIVGLIVGGSAVQTSWVLLAGWLLLVFTALLARTNRQAAGGLQISAVTARAVGLDLPREQRRSLLGRLALGVPVVIAVVAIGVAGTATLPIADGSQRFDVREMIPQPIVPRQALSPLAAIQNQLLNKEVPVMTISGVPAGVDRVRVATLGSYDGLLFTDDAQFLPAATRLPVDALAARGDAVTVDVTVEDDVFGGYAPTIGTPVGLVGTGFGYSATSGTLITQTPLDTYRYQLTTEVRDIAPPSTAEVDTSADPKYLSLPTESAPLALVRQKAREATSGSSGYGRLRALTEYYSKLGYSHSTEAGHSVGVLGRMVSRNVNTFAEQRAAGFVVMARSLGIPARVGVGYLLERKSGDEKGTISVRAGTATAWAEVPVRNFGWVPFDVVTANQLGTATDQTDPSDVIVTTVPSGSIGPSSGPSNAASDMSTGVSSIILVVILTVGALAMLVVLIIGEKFRRRWARRRAASPAAQLLGAWRDVEDRLVERGVPVRRSSSSIEVASTATRTIGAPPATSKVAVMATAAVYAPEEPAAADVTLAWKMSRDVRRGLSAGVPWWKRLWGVLDPRPLIRLPKIRGRHQ
jgi:Transglutaminase-like superfamily